MPDAVVGSDTPQTAPVELPAKRSPVAALEATVVDKLSAAETTVEKAVLEPTISKAAEATKAAPSEPSLENGPEAGLSFFQMNQEEEHGNKNTQELDDEKWSWLAKVEEKLKEEKEVQAESPDDGEEDDEDTTSKDEESAGGEPAEEAPATDEVAWKAEEMSAASLQSKLGQLLVVFLIVALVVNLMFRWQPLPNAISKKMRKKLERMPVATGPEIRSVCAGGGDGDKP